VTTHDFGNWINVDAEIHFPLLSINSNNHRNRIMDSSDEMSTSDATENKQTFIVVPTTSFSMHCTLGQLVAEYVGEALQHTNRLKQHSIQQQLALARQVAETQQAFYQQIAETQQQVAETQQSFTDQMP
jgi:hypothetical protein